MCVLLLSLAGALLSSTMQSPRPPTAEAYRQLVQEYGDRLANGEQLRIGREVPRENASPLTTAFENVAWARFDVDQSGGLNWDEWLEKAWGHQLLYDANGDGRISEAEFVWGRSEPIDASNAAFVPAEERRNRRRFRSISRSQATFGKSSLWFSAKSSFVQNNYDHDDEVTREDIRSLSRRWQ